MRTLIFGTFDPVYGRNRVLRKGLRDNGIETVICNGGTTGGLMKFVRLVWRYVAMKNKRFDMIIVAFPAQEAMLIAGVLFIYQRLVRKTPIIADMLTSHYDGQILNRKKYTPDSLPARWYKWIDRTAIRLADCAIVDSDTSGQFFIEELGVPADKLVTIFIGTDDDIMKPVTKPQGDQFIVHFHGNFIAHQGVEYIIKAAHALRNEAITFQLLGRGQEYARCRALAESLGLSQIRWVDPVPYEKLPDFINGADICLGPMGGTGHFDRCAPNKIFEYMACGKAIIVGNSKALHRIAQDGVNMILTAPADDQDLAGHILTLKHNPELRENLGRQARKDFVEYYTPQKLTALLVETLRQKQLL